MHRLSLPLLLEASLVLAVSTLSLQIYKRHHKRTALKHKFPSTLKCKQWGRGIIDVQNLHILMSSTKWCFLLFKRLSHQKDFKQLRKSKLKSNRRLLHQREWTKNKFWRLDLATPSQKVPILRPHSILGSILTLLKRL